MEEQSDEEEQEEFMWALHGEFVPGLAYPKVMMLPGEALQAKQLNYPSGAQFNAKRTDSKAVKATWFTTSNVNKHIGLPSMIPVPPCLVYDAFDKDIDSIVVYERWMVHRQELQDPFKNIDVALRTFLQSQVVKPTAKFPQGQVSISAFIEEASKSSNDWKREQIRQLEAKAQGVGSPHSSTNQQHRNNVHQSNDNGYGGGQ